MHQVFDKRLVIGLSLVVAVLLANAAIAYRNTRQLHDSGDWVAHTQEVLDALDDLVSTMRGAETGQRGFLITGRERDLESCERALAAVDGKVRRLQQLTGDNAHQQSRIPRLQELIRAKSDELTRTITVRQSQGFPAARQNVLNGPGDRQMDDVRAVVAEMRDHERGLLRDREQANDRAYRTSLISGAAVSLTGLALVAGVIAVLRRHLEHQHRASARLSEQREWLRATLTSIGDGVIATDAEGRVTFLNGVAESLTGWSEDEARGHGLETVFQIENEKTRRTVENPATRALRDGVIIGLANHTILTARDGTERAIADSAAPIRHENGEVAGVVLVFRDVTGQRKTERDIQFLASIVQSSDDAIIGKDVNGIITSWNPGAERLFGYTAAEAVGRSIAMLAPPDRVDDLPGILDRIRRGECVEHFETVRRAKNGRLLPISLALSPIKDEEGQIVGASKVARDISERRRAEEAVRESQRRETERADELEAVLRATPTPIWMAHDPECRVVTGNPAALVLLGLPEGWNLSATAPDRDPARRGFREYRGDEPIPAEELPMQRAGRGEVVSGVEVKLVFDDGRVRYIYGNAAPLRNPDGHIRGCIGAFADVTPLKEAEDRLRDADRRKDEFLATLAHELRNPLAPIHYAAELLRRAEGDAGLAEQTHGMLGRQLDQMVRLVDDLLDVNRISQGNVQLRKERVELATVVRSAVETVHPFIEAQGHELTVALPSEAIYLDADPTRLAQVVSNLINNAAKYTDKGGHIWLTVERQGGEAVILVRDTGIGMAPEHLLHIFEMFSQVAPALERSHGGLGIGLSLVRGLVELHGGQVEAHSDGIGRGSEFMVRLPVVDAPVPSGPEQPADGDRLPAAEKCRVLAVDDNRDAADSLAALLQMTGHETCTAYDGLEAVQAAAAFRPDVVLLDIGLPKMNGYEVARQIKQRPWGKHMILIALTGWGQEEDKRRALEAGCDHHLTKPVEPMALEKLLALITPGSRP